MHLPFFAEESKWQLHCCGKIYHPSTSLLMVSNISEHVLFATSLIFCFFKIFWNFMGHSNFILWFLRSMFGHFWSLLINLSFVFWFTLISKNMIHPSLSKLDFFNVILFTIINIDYFLTFFLPITYSWAVKWSFFSAVLKISIVLASEFFCFIFCKLSQKKS